MQNFNARAPPSRAPTRPASPVNQKYGRDAAVVLVGQRGVGKSTLAFIAAQALGSELIETRQLPASHRKQDRLDRDQSASEVPDEDARPSLGSILSDYRRGNILVIDSDELYSTDSRIALGHFAQTVGPVIHVTREKDKVLEYLEQQEDIQNQDIQRIKDEWDATESMLLELCSYSFVSLFCSSDTSSNDHGKQQSSRKDDVQSSTKGITHKRLLGPHLKPLERDFIRLLRFIHGVYTNHVPITSNRSYLLSLTYGHVSQLIPHIEELAIGIDCWELRVDLLAHNDPISLAQQISLLRRHSDLPIYFTMRTRSQAGMMPEFKDEPSLAGYQRAVLSLAVKMGLEYVDISLASPYDNITNIVRNKGNSQIVMSWHDLAGRVGWSGPEPRSIIDYACREGADVVMMIGFARDFQDNLSLRAFVEEVQSRRIPIIALNAGTQGKMSRILNTFLTPVSHPAMAKVSSPGQVSYLELQQVLYLTGLSKPLEYHIFGADVKTTASSIMHTVGFRALGLPHRYHISEAHDIRAYETILNDPAFGGASIARPFKVEINRYLRRLSKHAYAIGAINTITSTPSGPVGDNTDWKGIRTCINRALAPENALNANTTALVIGAGGVSRAAIYALNHLGVSKIALVNRSIQNARELANDIVALDPQMQVQVIDSIEPNATQALALRPRIIIYAIPLPEKGDPDRIHLTPHQGLLTLPGGGVLLDMTFQGDTSRSILLELSTRPQNSSWAFVPGIEVLLEQGYEQFRLWTGKRPPKVIMREAVLRQFYSSKLYK